MSNVQLQLALALRTKDGSDPFPTNGTLAQYKTCHFQRHEDQIFLQFRGCCPANVVEAAHIHPFSEAGDDDPRNGLALTPDLHWAMDRHLIALGPDLCWHVSPMLVTV